MRSICLAVTLALGLVLAAVQPSSATYTQQAALANDGVFQGQVQVAMLQAAANVMTEATSGSHTLRAQFAIQVIQNPTKWTPIVSALIASQNNNPMTPLTPLPSTVADTLVQTAVNAQWSNLAGYFAQ